MAYRRRQQPPPMNSGITEDEKVMLVVEEEGKQIHVNDYTAAAAAFKSKATRSISTTTAATSPSSAFYSSSNSSSSSSTTATSLAAKAIRASSAAHTHRDSSLSSAYAHRHPISTHTSSTSSSFSASISDRTAPSPSKGWDWGSQSSKPSDGEQASTRRNLNEAKHQQQPQGFWGNLARKAKTLLDVDEDEDNPLPSPPQRQQQRQRHHFPLTATKPRYQNSNPNYESHQKKENPTLQKSLNAISSSLSYIGNAVEEGLTVVENRTAGIIQETRKHIKSKSTESTANSHRADHRSMRQPSQRQMQMPPQMETDIELQLKASRDVAMAMAAKAKLLLRELKTVKADLAFAKERSAQLEDENKILRENRERGDNPEDDDLIRLQLETLLAEKARLAHENSVYARENRFLREVVEYHQLTMQDVVYLDEGTEEVTEVYPVKVVSNSHAVNTLSPPLPTESSVDSGLQVTREISPRPVPPPGLLELTQSAATTSSYTPTTVAVDTRRHLNPSV